MSNSYCKKFREMVASGEYDAERRADRAARAKERDQERTRGKLMTRRLVEAHYAEAE
jgi:hypothetical protein